MGLVLTNNVASLTAQNNLGKTNTNLSKSLERLSTGLKVNRGADGPAALVISEKQRAQISGLKTAIDNTNKAVSLVQTGEGALNEVNSLLGKARSLALDSANAGVNDSNSYAANQAELDNILKTINNIAGQTQFGQKKLLDGSGDARALTTQTAGASLGGRTAAALNATDYTFNVTTTAAKSQQASTGAFGVTGAGTFTVTVGSNTASVNLGLTDTAATSSSKINAALQTAGITGVQATDGFNGANAGRLYLTATDFTTDFTTGGTATISNHATGAATHTNAVINYTDSLGNATSVTASGNTAALTGELNGVNLTLGQNGNSINSIGTPVAASVGESLTFQIGANQNQTASIDFRKVSTDTLGAVGADTLASIRVDSATDAQTAIAVIDQAITDVSSFRGDLGAFQANTLESNANNLRTTLENTTAAESVIRDTDFASEIAAFTKLQTQLQAGSTVLGNANQLTSQVAQLLRG
jgi:flagellin